eukprot:1472400-Rhodomonas_salina.3
MDADHVRAQCFRVDSANALPRPLHPVVEPVRGALRHRGVERVLDRPHRVRPHNLHQRAGAIQLGPRARAGAPEVRHRACVRQMLRMRPARGSWVWTAPLALRSRRCVDRERGKAPRHKGKVPQPRRRLRDRLRPHGQREAPSLWSCTHPTQAVFFSGSRDMEAGAVRVALAASVVLGPERQQGLLPGVFNERHPLRGGVEPRVPGASGVGHLRQPHVHAPDVAPAPQLRVDAAQKQDSRDDAEQRDHQDHRVPVLLLLDLHLFDVQRGPKRVGQRGGALPIRVQVQGPEHAAREPHALDPLRFVLHRLRAVVAHPHPQLITPRRCPPQLPHLLGGPGAPLLRERVMQLRPRGLPRRLRQLRQCRRLPTHAPVQPPRRRWRGPVHVIRIPVRHSAQDELLARSPSLDPRRHAGSAGRQRRVHRKQVGVQVREPLELVAGAEVLEVVGAQQHEIADRADLLHVVPLLHRGLRDVGVHHQLVVRPQAVPH